MLHGEGLTDSEVGVHAALRIRGNQHQALACGAGFTLAGQAVVDTGRLQVCNVNVTVCVVGDLAGHEGRSAELGRCDHGVAGATATGVAGLDQMSLQVAQQFRLSVGIDQGHHAFFHVHLRQFPVFHLDLGVNQCCAQAIGRVLFHVASVILTCERRIIRIAPPLKRLFASPRGLSFA